MTFNLEYDSSAAQYIMFISDPLDATSYNLTISLVGNGNVYPFEGTQAQTPGNTVAINAIADLLNDWRFDKWTINGLTDLDSLTSVEMNKVVEAIATFIKQYEVTISSNGNGTVSPVGTSLYDIDTQLEITATPDASYGFTNFLVNDVSVLDNPYTLNVQETSTVVAFFESLIEAICQWVFKEGDNIESDGADGWQFPNSGTGDTPVAIKDSMVLTFDGASVVSYGKTLFSGQDYFDYTIIFKTGSDITTYQIIGGDSFLAEASLINVNAGKIELSVRTNITRYVSTSFNASINTIYKARVLYENNIAYFYINDILINQVNVSGTINTSNAYFSVGGEVRNVVGQYRNYFTGKLIYCEAHSALGDLICYFQDSQGVVIKDRSGNGNDGTLIGANQAVAWGTRSDEAFPALQEYGHSDYLVNTVAGTAATLASPDGSNLGEEKILNNNLSSAAWREGVGATLNNDNTFTTTAAGGIFINNLIIGNYYSLLIKGITTSVTGIKIVNSLSTVPLLAESNNSGNFNFSLNIFKATSESLYLRNSAAGITTELYLSVKEVTAIPAYGELEFQINYNAGTTYNIALISGSGSNVLTESMMFQLAGTIERIGIFKDGSSAKLLTANGYLTNGYYYKFKFQYNETENQYFTGGSNSIRLLIKGGSFTDWTVVSTVGGKGSNPYTDDSYTTTKFITLDLDAGDQISHISKDGVRYDPYNFSDGTGTYVVRNSIGLPYDASAYYRYDRLICNASSGIAATLASPDGSNVGVERLVNGTFDVSTGWFLNTEWNIDIENSKATNDGTSSFSKMYQYPTHTDGALYQMTIEVSDYVSGTLRLYAFGNSIKDITSNGIYKVYFTASSLGGAVEIVSINCACSIDNVSLKEVTEIPAYGEWEMTLKSTSNLNEPYIFIINDGTINNGIALKTYVNRVYIARFIDGERLHLFYTAIDYISPNVIYQYKIQRNSIDNEYFTSPANWIRVLIKGGIYTDWTVVDTTGGVGTNPLFNDTYNTTKLFITNMSVSNEISHITKDSVSYDVNNFSDDTGVYSVIPKAPDGEVDADLNSLEVEPNAGFSNCGNTLQNKDDVDLNAKLDILGLTKLKYPNKFTFDDLNDIDLDAVSPDFILTSDGTVITDMKIKE